MPAPTAMITRMMTMRKGDSDIDFHAHILPNCDHGSDSVQMSLRQLHAAARAGIHTVCATPHFYPHLENADAFLARRAESSCILQAQLTDVCPRILLGAEVLACAGLEKMDNLHGLCLENTNLLLLEMPFTQWSREVLQTVRRLTARGDLQIVLAHAERYAFEEVCALMQNGVQIQVNAQTLCKRLHGARWRRLLRDGALFAVGSDIHGLHTEYADWIKCKKTARNGWEPMMETVREAVL